MSSSGSMIERLPTFDDNKLLALWQNCWKKMKTDPARAEEAARLLQAIHAVWDARLIAAKKGGYKATTPEEGMLKALDYRVGNQGEPMPVRREIIRFIMTQKLPFVGSPAYMSEWGEPCTNTRYTKFRNVLHSLQLKSTNNNRMEKACREWIEDRDWLTAQWNAGAFKIAQDL